MPKRAVGAPTPRVTWAVDARRAARGYDALPPQVRPILRLCDGRRDLEAICAASALPRASTEKIVRRLESLGLITPTAVAAVPARGAAATSAPAPVSATVPVPVPAPAPVPAAVPAVAPAPVEAVHFSREEEAFFAQPLPEELPWDDEGVA